MPNVRITDLPEATSVSGNDLLVLVDPTASPPVAKSVAASYVAAVAPVSAVSGKTGAVTLQIANVNNLQIALNDLLPVGNYVEFIWATRTITGTVNDYSVQPANMLRLNTIGNATISGFSGGSAYAWHRVINVSQNNITILHQSAQSTAANRISMPGNTFRVLFPNQDAIFFYDPITECWRSPGCPYTYSS